MIERGHYARPAFEGGMLLTDAIDFFDEVKD